MLVACRGSNFAAQPVGNRELLLNPGIETSGTTGRLRRVNGPISRHCGKLGSFWDRKSSITFSVNWTERHALKMQRMGLMHKLLTGQIRVTTPEANS